MIVKTYIFFIYNIENCDKYITVNVNKSNISSQETVRTAPPSDTTESTRNIYLKRKNVKPNASKRKATN